MAKNWKWGIVSMILILSACAKTTSIDNRPTANVQTTESPVLTTREWTDTSIYSAGLISSEQPIISQMTGASIYHIDIQIADDMLSLLGQEDVLYTNQEDQPLKDIYFQLFPNMEGGSSTITAASVDDTAVTPKLVDRDASLQISLPAQLDPGKKTLLHIEFKVDLPKDAGGNYGLFGFIDNILVLDGFYPAIPVYDSKGWHYGLIPPNSDTTFQDASFYKVTVTAPKDLVIVATGVRVDSQEKDGKQIVTFAQGPARDFYIVASNEFSAVSQKIGETVVNSYSVTGMKQGAELALETAVEALKTYSKDIGPYPYTEFDVVSTPMSGAYGIEYPGIVGINYALYDTSGTINGAPTSTYLESTVAHETAHQWFYNVVGNDQINEPWLDESMAQYITALYFLDRYGQSGYDGYKSTWYTRWDRVNRMDKPIGLPAASYEGREYSGIVYGRGPLFIETLAKTMGQEKFNQFLKDYFLKYKWGIATTAGYKMLAEQECGCDLTTLFTDWVYPK